MADEKITGLPPNADPADADLLEMVDDVAGTPANVKVLKSDFLKVIQAEVDTNTSTNTGSVTVHSDVNSAGSGAIISTAERNKLAGIEDNATADQTPAQIKTAYESNANTNEFGDTEQTNLGTLSAGPASDADALHTHPALAGGGGSGDVVGPASAVDGNVTLFDGVTGKLVKDGLVAGADLTTLTNGSNADALHTHAGTGGGLDNIVEDTTPQLGGPLDLNEQPIVAVLTPSETFAQGEFGVLNSALSTGPVLANATTAPRATGIVVMAVDAVTAGVPGTFAMGGMVANTGVVDSAPYFLGLTDGTITSTAPTADGNAVRPVGSGSKTNQLALSQDSTVTVVNNGGADSINGVQANVLQNDSTPTLGGDLTLNGNGFVAELTAGGTIGATDFCYLNTTTQKVELAQADDIATSGGALFAARAAYTLDQTGKFLIFGLFEGFTGLTVGARYYLSETVAGGIQTTPPSGGSVARVVGQALNTTTLLVQVDTTVIVTTL